MLKIMAKRKILVGRHHDKRTILRIASNSQLTTKQITEECSVSASVSSIRRVLLFCENIKRLKLKKKPSLTTKHKELKNAIVHEWDTLSKNYIQKLYKSIPNRTIEIIENKGDVPIIK